VGYIAMRGFNPRDGFGVLASSITSFNISASILQAWGKPAGADPGDFYAGLEVGLSRLKAMKLTMGLWMKISDMDPDDKPRLQLSLGRYF